MELRFCAGFLFFKKHRKKGVWTSPTAMDKFREFVYNSDSFIGLPPEEMRDDG
jgi:hypothetical protein